MYFFILNALRTQNFAGLVRLPANYDHLKGAVSPGHLKVHFNMCLFERFLRRLRPLSRLWRPAAGRQPQAASRRGRRALP